MNATHEAQLRQRFRIARIIAGAMAASLLIYWLVLEILMRTGSFSPAAPEIAERLRWVLLAAAAAVVAASVVVRRAVLGQPGAAVPGARLHSAMVVGLAMSESAGLFGFVLALLAGRVSEYLPFLALGGVGMALHFPRWDAWEAWARVTPR